MLLESSQRSKLACADGLSRLRSGDGAPLAAWLRSHLFAHVLPFWERYALDPHGGILTCLQDNGQVNSTEKWLWSQWRAVWVFSRLHRSLDASGRWLQHARQIAEFCICHGWDAGAGHWALLLSDDGKVLRGYDSIHVDAFAIQALRELYLASGEAEYLQLARKTADSALAELEKPRDTIPHFPYPIPAGARPHAIPMMWSLVLAELGAVTANRDYLHAAGQFSDEIFGEFYRPERDLCLEFLRLDGSELPAPTGTASVPGHAIESMWFQIHVADILGRGRDRVRLACDLILRHLELGWDDKHGGGILLAVDADGSDSVGWKFASTKLWWPHTEALYAVLLGWKIAGDPRFLEWFERLWRLCLDHYVDWRNGEWRQKLDRTLAPLEQTIALPVKDPFHLPRSLIFQIELLERSDPGKVNGRSTPRHLAAAERRPPPGV